MPPLEPPFDAAAELQVVTAAEIRALSLEVFARTFAITDVLGWFADAPDPVLAVRHLAESGVRALPVAGRVRFITHRDVDAAGIGAALDRLSAARL